MRRITYLKLGSEGVEFKVFKIKLRYLSRLLLATTFGSGFFRLNNLCTLTKCSNERIHS